MASRVIKQDKGSREIKAEQKPGKPKWILGIAEARGLVKSHMPEAGRHIPPFLPGKTVSQISSVGSKQRLSNETLAPVKQPLAPQSPKRSVSGVFFTSFIIQ